LKGRTTEALSTNLELDNIQSGLQTIFKKVEMTDEVSLERIKSEYLGKKEDVDTLMSLFNKHNSDVARQVGVSVEAATLQKYNVCKKHFSNFLRDKYGRSDIRLSELGYIVIHDFDIYLRTVVGQNPNT
ncbi:phage integrase SAM-like domain-containing protein, partial [Prevotella bivia]